MPEFQTRHALDGETSATRERTAARATLPEPAPSEGLPVFLRAGETARRRSNQRLAENRNGAAEDRVAMPRFLLARSTPAAVAKLAQSTAKGVPVPASLRAPLEADLGSSLATARLHQGPEVTAELQALKAPAAALGRHVFLSGTAPSALVPQMVQHELAHVAQARLAEPDLGRPLYLGARGDALERQTAGITAGVQVGSPLNADPNTLHRYDGPGPSSSATPEGTLDTHLFLLEELILDAEEDDPVEAARLERELLLAQFTHQEGFHSVEGVEEFIRACELGSEEEADTLRMLGGDSGWIVRQYPQAFPAWWANHVKERLWIDTDPASLQAAIDTAWTTLESLSQQLPAYIAKFGLPVDFQEALSLTKFRLSSDHARMTEPHLVGAFAQAALKYRSTGHRSAAFNQWQLFLNRLVESIKSGEVVIDPDELDRLTGSATKLGGLVRSGGTPAEDEFRMLDAELGNLQLATFAVALVAFGSSIKTGAMLWQNAEALFQSKLAEADTIIEDASFLNNIGRGFLWATDLGYFSGSAALIAAAISENFWDIIETVLMIAGAQAIPGVNIIVDLYLLFTVGTDLISAMISLARALHQAGASDAVVEMQQASARLAVALLQDTMRVVLDFLGIKGTVALLERSVAKIRAANPSISQRDAVRQAVRERQTAGTGTSPKPPAGRNPDADIDAAFARLESGAGPPGQGAMLGDLMFHQQRAAALDELRRQLGNLPGRPGRTPPGVAVNPQPGYQSAHTTAQSVLRDLPAYDPGAMITRFLPTGRGHPHTLFDQHWQAQFRAIRDATGRTQTTAQELAEVTARAARQSGAFSAAEAESVAQLVINDLYFQLRLSPSQPLRMPGT